jgi:hypothetical protein
MNTNIFFLYRYGGRADRQLAGVKQKDADMKVIS